MVAFDSLRRFVEIQMCGPWAWTTLIRPFRPISHPTGVRREVVECWFPQLKIHKIPGENIHYNSASIND